jgi:hypothetical protein
MERILRKDLVLKSSKSFRLMEALFFVFIFFVLIVTLSFSFSNIPKKERDRRGMKDLRTITHILELKYNENLRYPDLPDSAQTISSTLQITNPLFPYLENVPKGNGVREYYWKDDGSSNPQNFCVYFQLEVDSSKYFSCTRLGCKISGKICE